ncbi:Peptide deformylase 2 [Achlya hypogyna]|uniref:Peptide deformylase n=1 Tax=Achlya hypogyna TaxID=1202772 RepID=A0A1V9ZHZ9_ACHHY|nr:Peptide deformylase 2 [Achlya hypogyna]
MRRLAVAKAVLFLGEPSLRRASAPVSSSELRSPIFWREMDLLKETLESFRAANGFGRGIAAPQIGINKRLIAVNLGDGPRLYVNPVILKRSRETFTMWDDCMCFPDLLVKVARHRSISIKYTDEKGTSQAWNDMELPIAELFQHEIDHLDGILAVDRAVGAHGADMTTGELLVNFPAQVVSRSEFEKQKALYEAAVDYVI